MYLKRIEMSGFKSFADRTIINFEQGLTAIVGPNGSGKSNVTEAVRWVLGEQSAKNLRGDKMYDVIFSGTSKRKSMNVCEVIIVLDNSDHTLPIDYDEVSVMRRLTRTGESYYAINKKQCRLKDIIELFMDSGLGKHSFSIISQGKVEAIFDDKPENRRALFEETAGVLKYKQRKQQAEQKLSETEDNLERLDDIIYELKNQLVPLKEQVDAALVYQDLTKKYQELDLSLQVTNIKADKQKYDNLAALLPKQQREIDSKEKELGRKQGKNDQITQNLKLIEQRIEHLQVKQIKLIEEYEKQQAFKQVANERKQHQAQTKQELQQAILEETGLQTELSAKIATEVTNNHDLTQKLAKIQQEVKEYQQELNDLDQEANVSYEELQDQYFNYMQEQATVRNEKQHLEKKYQQEQARNQRQIAQEEQIKASYQRLENEIKQLQEQQQEQKRKLVESEEQLTTLTTTLAHEKEQLQKREQQKQQAVNLYQQVLAKHKSLTDLQQNYHGFYQGVKAVLQAKKKLGGIDGAVAECLQMEAKYTHAIEVAIGSAMQNIIVRDEKAASQAISYLKKTQQGRATFLPLSIIKGKTLNDTILQIIKDLPGFIGLGIDLVNFDSKYTQVMASLLGNTIVVDNLQNANQLSRNINYQYKVVTLEGEIIRPGGAMTGGNNKQNGGLLSQQAELEELKQRLPEMQAQIQRIDDKITEQVTNLEEIETAKEEVLKFVQNIRIDLQNTEKLLAVKEQQFEQISKEHKIMLLETKELTEFFVSFDKDLARLAEREKWLTEEINQLQRQLNKINQSKEAKQQKREYLLEELSQLKATQEFQRTTVEANQKRIAELKEQKQKTTKKITKWQTQLEIMAKEVSQADLAKVQAKLQELEQNKQVVGTQLEQLRTERDDIKVKLGQLEKQIKADYEVLSILKTNYQKQLLDYEQLDQKLNQALEYLQTEYQLTYEFASKQAKPLELTLTEATDKLQVFQRQIKNLGPVNLAALEQYEQLQERYQFMTEQRQDLVDAKLQLLKTMGAMDQKVKQQFKQTFEEIAIKFSELFPKIFGGGRAALHLTDETDLLNTGIEIEAEPPGKKLQRLSLLSGGEKSLTAITLLFAMIQARPVPFCILDEVEAALDEANVYRFGSYLQHLDDKTQFIVITHRKGTMEAADTLYGVTMQESGVSSLVSVKMENLAAELKK